MLKPHFTQEQLVQVARLSPQDVKYINACRGLQNKIGAAYQLCFIKLFNRFPAQSPFEPIEELATFVAIQLDIPRDELQRYALQRSTFFRHQDELCVYLGLKKFDSRTVSLLNPFLFQQALQIQAVESLFLRATEFLKDRRILNPADDTIERLIQTQREKARKHVFSRINAAITPALRQELDTLLIVGQDTYSKLYKIKEVPKKPSAQAMKQLAEKLALIEGAGALTVNLDWLNVSGGPSPLAL
jgi:hypothetical protein